MINVGRSTEERRRPYGLWEYFTLPGLPRECIWTRGSYGNCSAHEVLRSEARKKKEVV